MKPPPGPDDFTGLLESLGVEPEQVDLVLAGDGSGTTRTQPCGWACALYEVASKEVHLLRGCSSNGTNNVAEMTPYINALWLHQSEPARLTSPNPLTRVLIISDSEWLVRCGRHEYARNVNLHLWAALDSFLSSGYQLDFVHVRRNSNPIHTWADRVASSMRKLLV